jgi:hypothetical protein
VIDFLFMVCYLLSLTIQWNLWNKDNLGTSQKCP